MTDQYGFVRKLSGYPIVIISEQRITCLKLFLHSDDYSEVFPREEFLCGHGGAMVL